MVDSRAIFRMGMGFHIGLDSGPYETSYVKSMSFGWAYQQN